MRRGFWAIVYSSFKKVYNGIVGVGGFVVAVMVYIFAFEDNAAARVILGTAAVTTTLLLILLLTFIDTTHELYTSGANVLPAIRAGMDPFPGSSAALVCVSDPSELFSYGIWVSFFRLTGQQVEVPVGTGGVINVQQDGKILMEMTRVFEGQDDFVQKVRQNDAAALAALLAKPHVPQQMFGSVEEQS
jgi:hypothetical protein